MSQNQKTLFIELFTEELPPLSLKKLANSLTNSVHKQLEQQRLLTEYSTSRTFATPRRLGVSISNVLEIATSQKVKEKLTPVKVGFQPLIKRLQKLFVFEFEFKIAEDNNINVINQISQINQILAEKYTEQQPILSLDESSQTYFIEYLQKGISINDKITEILEQSIKELPIAKTMFYQRNQQDIHFIRPVHGLTVLHGEKLLESSVLGVQSTRQLQGHRFLSNGINNPEKLILNHADDYVAIITREGQIVPDFDTRQEAIKQLLLAQAKQLNATAIISDDLLEEVTALVETPHVVVGCFDEEFLEVPAECLILTMQKNQKYFTLEREGKLINQFLVVTPMFNAEAQTSIIKGNERVVKARLADAQFFYQQDKQKSLDSLLPQLSNVIYHQKLGNQEERRQRLISITEILNNALLNETTSETKTVSEQAVRLCKVDLLTNMVGEFPELQGIMGGYYAPNKAVGQAILEHYQPRFAGDNIPNSDAGAIVALADKLETLVGLFAIGQIPTGDKDPFSLRRHALGCIRILLEKGWKGIELSVVIPLICDTFKFSHQIDKPLTPIEDTTEQILTFIAERLKQFLLGQFPEQKTAIDVVLERLGQKSSQWLEINPLLTSIIEFQKLPEAIDLAAGNKRMGQILKKENRLPILETPMINIDLFEDNAEHELYNVMQSINEEQNYTEFFGSLAPCKTQIDNFFNQVMVNHQDTAIRDNRLNLLAMSYEKMNRFVSLGLLF